MKGNRGSIDGILLILFFAILTALTVAGFLARAWLPRVASEHGADVDGMISYLLVATGVIFVVGHAVLIAFLWRYRSKTDAQYAPVSRRAEWAWTLVPVLVMALVSEGGVLVIGLPIWSKVYGEAPKDALVVEAVGKQFEWLIRYPGQDGTFGRVDPALVDAQKNPVGLDPKDPAALDDLVVRTLHIPVNRHVVVRIRSHDVLHSFAVPEFRIKQDAIPGYTAKTQFTATQTGTFEIACAELCGLGHFRMRSVVYVKSESDFKKWLGNQVPWLEE